MRAQDLMTSPVITCHVNDSLNAAAQKLWDDDIGVLAVVNDDGKLTGVLTDRDICMAAYTQARALDSLLVNGAMAHEVFSVSPEASLEDIEHLMAQHQVRRIPVVDGNGKPIGIVSLNDLALEAVRPESRVKHGPAKLARMLAAICQRRTRNQHAA